jgi:hypothetical protein
VDKSYDLTGDGTVSVREYRLAKHFDKNQNGVLDSDEKRRCIQAIKDGFEFPKIKERLDTSPDRYTRTKMLSERKLVDKNKVNVKWNHFIDKYNQTIDKNM